MNDLAIQMAGNRTAYRPGEMMAGEASWALDTVPESVELRLSWHTKGKGTVDTETVEVVRFEKPQLRDKRAFRVKAPDGPYSFSGKLVALIWGLELTVQSDRLYHVQSLVISPDGVEVELPVVADAKGGSQ